MEPFFFDTSAIDLLRDRELTAFWRRFPEGTKHFLSFVVYWEYMRQFDPKRYAPRRTDFRDRMDGKFFEVLDFDKRASDVACEIYLGVKERLPDDDDGKIKLKDMHCDIIIASTAYSHGKIVLVNSIDDDWSRIYSAVQGRHLGTLRLNDKKGLLP